MARETLIADKKGIMYTDGETYGSEIYLAEGLNKEGFHEIPISEYEALQPTEEVLNGV